MTEHHQGDSGMANGMGLDPQTPHGWGGWSHERPAALTILPTPLNVVRPSGLAFSGGTGTSARAKYLAEYPPGELVSAQLPRCYYLSIGFSAYRRAGPGEGWLSSERTFQRRLNKPIGLHVS